MNPSRRHVSALLGAGLCMGVASPLAWAQSAANQGPLKLIVPFTPGTGIDLIARTLGPKLSQRLNRPVVVENRVGASGNIGVTAAIAGALDGTVAVALASNANGVLGLTGASLTAQTLTVTGAAYDFATAAVASSLTLNNVRTGTLTNVSVGNVVTTSAAFQDSLDVAATSSNGKLTLTNPANIAAGASRNLVVNAATAGVLDATLTLALTSNANGVNGLNNAGLTAQTIAVTGAAYDLARPTVATTLAIGNRRVGYAADLNIANATLTSATYQDSLDVTSATSNAKLTLGSVANIAAGVDRNLVVTAATAGVLDATLTLGLTSNANSVTGLTNQALAGKTVTVTGAAYDIANASLDSSLVLGGVRVGSTANLAVTNAVRTLAAYQDDLGVTATAGTTQLTLANPALIAAGATRNVVVTAAKAGLLTDTLTLSLASKALTASTLADGATTSQTVAVTGTAYDFASATVIGMVMLLFSLLSLLVINGLQVWGRNWEANPAQST